MAVPKSNYKVYMYRNYFDAMCTEIYKHQDIQTGGNLFGLWTSSGSAIIHVVLGPGKDCKRTSTSFHQDLEYMARVGRFVNEKHQLCHIGEWRSHHSLMLDKPSAEDEITIRGNFPRGVSKFLVIIANIKNRDTIKLSSYFFTDGGQRYEIAEYEVLECDGPFSTDDKIVEEINLGAEGKKEKETRREVANHSATCLQNAGNQQYTTYNTERDGKVNRNAGLYFHQNVNSTPTYSQVASRSSHENSRQAGSIAQRYGNSCSTNSQATCKDQQSDKNANDEKAITKEIIMKNTFDELEKFFGQGKVEMEKSYDDINMIFEHDSRHWMVCFPDNFPSQPAKLYRVSQRQHFSSSSPCSYYNLEKPLTNHVNILLSIKKNCRMACKTCENISKENLTPDDGPTSLPVDDTAQTIINPPENGSAEIQTKESFMKDIYDELEKFFGKGKVEIKRKSSGIDMMFEHQSYHWMVRFLENFPSQPAKLYRERERRYFPSSSSAGDLYNVDKPLTNGFNILLSIKKNCSSSCKICKNINKEKLTKPPAAVSSVKTTSAEVIKALTNEIRMAEMATPLSFSEQTQNDGSHKIEFEHNYRIWSVKVPAEFPQKPAEVYKQESRLGALEKKTINDSSTSKHEQKLVSPDLIMLAIRSNCHCSPCRNNTS